MEKAQGASRLITSQNQGVLCTNSVKHIGYPFGSVTPFAIGAKGRPVFLFSNMAVHTNNLIADPKASLLVSEELAEGGLMAGARANALGSNVHRLPILLNGHCRNLLCWRFRHYGVGVLCRLL